MNTDVERTFQESAWKNSAKATDELIMEIINHQLDIKLGQFIQRELKVVLTKIIWKAASLDKILPEEWKTRKFDDILH